MVQRSKSSTTWMNEHVNDPYVQRAQKDGYRARAAYKLLEINEKADVLAQFESLLENRSLDLVICDMAPNMSGNAVMDQARSYYLCELALDFSQNHLKTGGCFLVKVFQGSGYQEYLTAMRETFTVVQTRKPDASRNRSSEIYLLGKNKR